MTQGRPARRIENGNLLPWRQRQAASERRAGELAIPIGLDKYKSGVCHSDLLSVTDTSPKAITCAPTRILQAGPRVLFHPDFDRRLRHLT